MKNYKWNRYHENEIINTGWLYAKNLHHAKHLVVLDANVEKGDWIDRQSCSIMLIPDTSDYLSLELS